MGKFERKAKRASADTAITAREAGAKRIAIIEDDDRWPLILKTYAEASERFPGEDVIVVVADPTSDTQAHGLAEAHRMPTDRVLVLGIARGDVIKWTEAWLDTTVLAGIERAPSGVLKVLCVAHMGALFWSPEPEQGGEGAAPN